MELNNGDLLDSAMTDEPVVTQEVATPPADQQDAGQLRDEQGRFAAQQAEQPAEHVDPAQSQQPPQGFVPSGRLREEREAREAIERRFQESQAQWQRELQQIRSQLPQQEQPKAPDVFENPDGFLQHGVRQAIDPIQNQIGQLREFYSQREAVREHGAEKVKAAYDWIVQGMQMNDPARASIYQRAMQSMDPYGEIVAEHQKSTVYSQIGNDPQAWFGKTLDERLSSDPKFAAEVLQKIQGAVQGHNNPQAQGNNIINVPPNLRRAPGARAGSEESGDMSNASLLAASMR
jgi:hypothetical protein